MSRRAYKSIHKSFRAEAEKAFAFLVEEFEMRGPEYVDRVLPTLIYEGDGLRYTVLFDGHEMAVGTEVDVALDTTRLVADLKQLVRAAGLGSPNEIPSTVHTLHDLQRALESHATFVRRLQPFLLPGPSAPQAAVDLLRKADAREWRL